MEKLSKLRRRFQGGEDIEISVENKQLVFRCTLTDEKELNIAAGKIHRNIGGISDEWKISGSVLILRLPTGGKVYKMNEIRAAFDVMVK